MRIFIFIAICLLKLCVADEQNFQNFDIQSSLQSDDSIIFSSIDEIFNINSDIFTFTQKSIDKNLTIFDDEISYLQAQKLKVLQSLPIELIKNKDANYEEVSQVFDGQIVELEDKVKELFDKNYFFDYIYTNNRLLALKATKSFYGTLFNLKQFFVEGANKRQIDRFLKDSIKDMQTKIFTDISDENQNLTQAQINTIEDAIEKYSVLLDGYEEILVYLSKNSYIFNESFLIKSLKLGTASNYISENLHLENRVFNSGKFLVMLFITVFIYIIRRLIYNLIYYIITRTILVKHYKEKFIEKSSVLKMIEKPIGFLLILFNIDLWITLSYHPIPLPKAFQITFEILYIFNLTWFIIALINIYGVIIIQRFTDVKDKKEVANLALKMLKIVIVIISFIVMLNRFGFDPTALVASFGIGGLAIAFASKDIIANFFSSILLIFESSISQGDDIEIGDISGTVVEIGLRNTIVRDEDNALIFIPNSKIVDSNIVNLSRRRVGRKMRFTVAIANEINKELIDGLMDEIKEMLYTNDKIAHVTDSSKNSEEVLDLASSFVSADDLEGFKNSIYVYLTGLEGSLVSSTDCSFGITIECFSKTVNARQYYKTKDEVFFNIMEILHAKELKFIFIKN